MRQSIYCQVKLVLNHRESIVCIHLRGCVLLKCVLITEEVLCVEVCINHRVCVVW